MPESTNPDCLNCVYRRPIPGDEHSRCVAVGAKVTADPIGVTGGWFYHPYNFDPRWLLTCNRFEAKDAPKRLHRLPKGECKTCDEHGDGMMPGHHASPRCESGGYNHCSCDTCF
jgi:hypothetical protein